MIIGPAKVGRWDIERHLASGGMAEVYQAYDPATGERVALKIPHDGEEIWDAERAGAGLQVELSKRDERVPRVLEIANGEDRYVAMEYIEGEDLSRRLQSGPLDWREASAVAIELCGVLGTARSCSGANGEPGGIVHGDIKPRNIRLQPGGRIKVLDFGIAKALGQARAETRNLYGSVPYSSPERLDRGRVDYASDLWSVAVVLYEMLEGKRPFQAPSDGELERLIRSGAPPAPLERGAPAAFQAVLDKAFAREMEVRYASAQELERDLRSLLNGSADVTRRTLPAGSPDLEATRRSRPAAGSADPEATRRSALAATNGAAPSPVAAAPALAPAPASPRRPLRLPWTRGVTWKSLALLALLLVGVREMLAFGSARDLRSGLASRPRGEAAQVWDQYEGIVRGHVLVHLSGIDGAVRDWMVSHADDLLSRYRSDTPTIYETGWRSAETLLQRAAMIDPGNRKIESRLEFCRAHLLRLAARDAKDPEEAMSRYDEAISRFERAAQLWPGWGDPHVGLAQVYAYGKRDPERTGEELDLARNEHYPFGERETALLGDAYRLRAEHRWAASTDAFDTEQQARHLQRVREDCAHALEQYELVPSYPGVERRLRELRSMEDDIDARLRDLERPATSLLDWILPGHGSAP